MLLRYGSPESIAPGVLAREFVNYSGLSEIPSHIEMRTAMRGFGVSDISPQSLPEHLRAHHWSFGGGNYTIEYEAGLWQGSLEFTMTHELYEIIHEEFEKLVENYEAPRLRGPTCMGSLANRFAAAVWLQEDVLFRYLINSGFDIVDLHHRFQKSYSGVAISSVGVVNTLNGHRDQHDPVDLMVTIYERTDADLGYEAWVPTTPDKLIVTYALLSSGFKLGSLGGLLLPDGRWNRKNYLAAPDYLAPRYPAHMMPKKGDRVVPGSITEHVINSGHDAFRDRAYGYDLWGFNDLSSHARIVRWGGNIAKVVVVTMRRSQADHLGREPYFLDDSFQIL